MLDLSLSAHDPMQKPRDLGFAQCTTACAAANGMGGVYQNSIRSLATRTWPEKCSFTSAIHPAPPSARAIECDSTTVFTLARVAILPMSSNVMFLLACARTRACSAEVMACQEPLSISDCIRSLKEELGVTSKSAPLASSVTASLGPVSPVNTITRSVDSKR